MIPFNVAKLTRRPPTSPTLRTSQLQRRRLECRLQTVAKSVAGVVESGLHGRFRAASFNASPSHPLSVSRDPPLDHFVSSFRFPQRACVSVSGSRPVSDAAVSNFPHRLSNRIEEFLRQQRQPGREETPAEAARANLTPCHALCMSRFRHRVLVYVLPCAI